MRDNEHVAFGVGVLETFAVVIFPDVCDDGVEAVDDLVGGSIPSSLARAYSIYQNQSEVKGKKGTYSPPGHPCFQISHGTSPFSLRDSLICLLVKPS